MQNENATSTVTLNGSQAKQELTALEQKAIRLKAALVEANTAGDGKAFNKLNKELRDTQRQMNQLQKEAFDVKKVLDNLSGSTMKELTKAQKQLNAEINSGKIKRGTEDWNNHQEQLKKVKAEIASVNAESKEGMSNFTKFAKFTNESWQLFAVAGMAIVGVTTVLAKYMAMRNQLEDQNANLKALTGLEDKDINKLQKYAEAMASNPLEGTGIRIRSSVIEIMEAYKLVGSAKPELLQDVDALNEVTKQSMILAAAAGMPLEEAVHGTVIALNQYGAAAKDANRYVNALGAGAKFGAVEVPYIAEALTKFGALAKDANVPIEQSIAAIETLGAKGFEADVTGTGLKQMFVKLMAGAKDTNPAIVGMSTALDNLNKKFGGPGGFSKMIDMFGEREVVIARSLIANREEFKNLSKAVTGTSSAMEQATINSQTTNAKIAQSTNQLNILAMQLIDGVGPAVLKVANLTNVFLRVLVQLPSWLKENGMLLLTLTGAMIGYTIAVKASAIAERAKNIEKAIGMALVKAETIADITAAAAKALLIGNITRARAAMRLLNAEMLVNPYVAIGVAIAAVTIAIYKFATAQTSTQKAWKEFNVQSQIEIQTADQLFEAVKKSNIGSTERKSLIEKINSQYGQYLTNQLTEVSNLDDIAQAQKTVNFALRDKIAIQTKEAAKAEITKKSVDKQVNTSEKLTEAFTSSFGETVGGVLKSEIMDKLNADPDNMQSNFHDESKRLWQKYGYKAKDIIYYLNEYVQTRTELAKEMKAIDKKFEGIYSKPYDPTESSIKGEITVTGHKKRDNSVYDNPEEDKKTLDAKRKKRIEAIEKDALIQQIALKKQHLKHEITEEEFNEKLVALTKESLKKKRDVYNKGDKEYSEFQNQIMDIDIKKQDDKAAKVLKAEKDLYETLSEVTTKAHRTELENVEMDFQDNLITQDQYDNKVLAINRKFSEKQWQDAVAFDKKMKAWHFQTEDTKLATIKESNSKVEKAAADLLAADNAIRKKGVQDRKAIEKEIDEIERKYGIDEKQNKHKEYETALKELKTAHEKELILHEKNAKAKADAEKRYQKDVAKIKVKQAEQTAEDISKISTEVGNLSSKLQEAEILSVENKYASQLKAAKGNADQTKVLEEQMEAEKVIVKKKYADIDFEINVAKIISSTALAVMKAWELGPIAGPILAVATGATGLAELAVAKEQRDAVHNLWTGGFTDDGGKYEPRGIVHAGEFVANQESVKSAPMRKVFNLVDYAQRTNTVARISSEDIVRSLGIRNGYSNGGFVSSVPTTSENAEGGVSKQDLVMIYSVIAQNSKLIEALHGQIQNGIQANVSITGKNGIVENTNTYNKLLNNAKR